MDFTPVARLFFKNRIAAAHDFATCGDEVQLRQLRSLLNAARHTAYGKLYGFADIDSYAKWSERVPVVSYEELKPYIMKALAGERDQLWRGTTTHFAQSSGTSDGRSKFIPITADSFAKCHYRGASDVVAHYLNINPHSRLFAGKAFILGGSFASTITVPKGVHVGDLSANLIQNINPFANLFRVPSKQVALMEDWEKKLPELVRQSVGENITNLSGVPSWFLSVLKKVLETTGATCIHQVWRNLEVFFHGGINFEPYREIYNSICDTSKMHFINTYNASEGFFATQTSWDTTAMMLLLDIGVFFEFRTLDGSKVLPIWEVQQGETYALIITANNGLWRYEIGDTVTIESLAPVKISIAGRTKHFINAFGEELMVHNADAAITATVKATGMGVLNYTAAPVYASREEKGRHQWLVEFDGDPDAEAVRHFAILLDENLRKENSDYDAKRTDDLFITRLEIVKATPGVFDAWLKSTGKLGGQRKIPRLSNDRKIIDTILKLNNQAL